MISWAGVCTARDGRVVIVIPAPQKVSELRAMGWPEDLIQRFIIAKARPPETTADIVDISELPQDRTYRDAWRRSHNGGPIWIDDRTAQAIDEARMWEAYNGARTA